MDYIWYPTHAAFRPNRIRVTRLQQVNEILSISFLLIEIKTPKSVVFLDARKNKVHTLPENGKLHKLPKLQLSGLHCLTLTTLDRQFFSISSQTHTHTVYNDYLAEGHKITARPASENQSTAFLKCKSNRSE